MSAIIEERLRILDTLTLTKGSHPSIEDGACVMEALSFIAGEKWSDSPQCACPVISAFLRRWNDDTDDACRQRLKPFIPRLVGTRATKEVEQRRGWMLTDWLIRVHAPAWLELAGLNDQANALRTLPEINDPDQLPTVQPVIEEARKQGAAAAPAAWAAAGDAAGAAAGDAAWAAAWAAAGDAAGAAAGDAAWAAAWAAAAPAAWAAAGDAAWAAAGDAAWDAAWAAAWDAASKKLEPTKLSLQESALQLLERLITCGN